MKKILISLMVMLLTISFGVVNYAVETTGDETTEELEAEIKLTTSANAQDAKTVELILSVGKIEGDISDLLQCGIEADLEYTDDIITDIQATKLDVTNIANVTCLNKKLLIEMTGITENTDLLKLTLTLKENVDINSTTFKLTNIIFTKNGEGNQESSQVTNSILTANITIKHPEENNANTGTQEDEKTQAPVEQQGAEAQKSQTPAETTAEDPTVAKDTIPKAGVRTIVLTSILVISIGVICLIKYKNIEIK